MTKQATFNKVVRHLREQKKSAMNENGMCAYLTPTGLRCAVGCLIPKKYLTSEFVKENCPVYESPVAEMVESLGHEVGLLSDLQHVHDHYKPRQWEAELRAVAEKHELTMPPKVAS